MTNITGFAHLGETLDDLTRMKFIIGQMIDGIVTSTLVEVVAVNGKTVDVKPLVNQIDGADTGIQHGTIHGLPWSALMGGLSAVIITPVVGDKGLAVFCHNDISTVKATQAQGNPGSRRRYSWADGIYMGALPMLNPAPTQTITMDSTGITITSGQKLTINCDVVVNGDLTTTNDVITEGVSLKNHKHSGVQAGSGQSGPPV